MAVKILFAPNHPKPILDVALALKPPAFELMIHDHGTPDYYRAAETADYYMGMTRNIDAQFFAAAKKMKLVQLLSAGYDRADVAAARKAGIPIANNGGANAIAVAEHTLMLMSERRRESPRRREVRDARAHGSLNERCARCILPAGILGQGLALRPPAVRTLNEDHALAIDYQKRDGVAYITLNNPAKANILDKRTSDEISTAWIDLWEDRAIRCAILTGAGDKHFCGGHNLAPRPNITEEEREYLRTQRIYWPLAGSVHGQKTGVDGRMSTGALPMSSPFHSAHGSIAWRRSLVGGISTFRLLPSAGGST